jgi:hypothetical protein
MNFNPSSGAKLQHLEAPTIIERFFHDHRCCRSKKKITGTTQ